MEVNGEQRKGDEMPVSPPTQRSDARRAPPRKARPGPMKDPRVIALSVIVAIALVASAFAFSDDGPMDDVFEGEDEDDGKGGYGYTEDFDIAGRTFASNGSNDFFVLESGYQLVLEGDDDGVELRVQITVLDDTRTVDGVLCRVVEEREWEDDELIEVSRNWFAIDVETDSVFYFGEEVDDYEDGAIVGHGGEWESGVGGAKAGLMMPGDVLLGSAYYQEVAPGVAMDRVVHVSVSVTLTVPDGTFSSCLRVMEDNPVDGPDREYKTYAPGIGLIQDEEAVLVSHGYI